MNHAHKNMIRKNYVDLATALSPLIDDVTRFFFQEKIISKRMMENILCKRTDTDKSYALLDVIPNQGPRAFECLYRATQEFVLFDAANILNPQRASHEGVIPQVTDQPPIPEQPDDELPNKWPSDHKDMESYKDLKLVESNHIDMNNLFIQSLAGQKHTYQMSGNPRGRVLIINNYKFPFMKDTARFRDGTQRDEITLKTLFEALYFDVHVENDKTAKEMTNLLQAEAEREDHNQYNCFILFILSHGHRGIVFGVDGFSKKKESMESGTSGGQATYEHFQYIKIDAIFDLFSNAKSLLGKPKLIFIQACQGDDVNEGYTEQDNDQQPSPMMVDHPNEATPPSSAAACSSSYYSGPIGATSSVEHDEPTGKIPKTTNSRRIAPMMLEAGDRQLHENIKTYLDDLFRPKTESDTPGKKRPLGADIFMAVSTIPGMLSWRNTVYGSWFIQAIGFVFARLSYKYDLLMLMTRVNNLVARAVSDEGYKQVGESNHRLLNDFYFFPGLYDGHQGRASN